MKKLTKSLVAVVAVGVLGGGSVAFAGGGMKGDGHRARMMEKFDTNKDGQLDESEKAAMMAKKQQRKQEMLARFDANKDGQLDETERKNAHAQKSAEIFKKLDADGNGQLSLTEFQQMRKAFGRHGGKH